MAFILLVRDGSVVRLLDSTVFETRQEALAAIPRADAPGETEELFLVDLEAASPIIVVPQAAPPVPDASEESSAGVWEAPSEPETVAEPLQEEAEPADLSTALRRATGALESAGIVAPESIASVPEIAEEQVAAAPELLAVEEPEAEVVVEPVAEVVEEPVAEVIEEPVAEAVEEPEAQVIEEPVAEIVEQPAADVAPAGWPWDVSGDHEDTVSAEPVDEPEPQPEVPSAPESLPEPAAETVEAYVPDPFEEPARDVEDFVYSGDADEALSLNRPVIMGAYGDDASAASVTETDKGESATAEAEPEDTAAEVVAAPEGAVPGDLADIALELEVEPTPDEVAEGADTPSAPEDEPVTPAYEAGSSDIAELTCDECVYINTCPKKGESDPSSCGSFQWKAI